MRAEPGSEPSAATIRRGARSIASDSHGYGLTLEMPDRGPILRRMYRWSSWSGAGLLLLSACGARSGLTWSSEDTGNAPHVGGAAGTGGGPGATTRVTTISAGPRNTCGVTDAGTVKCWGAGANSARGSGSSGDSSVPVDMTSLSSGVLAVSAGASTCALTSSGAVTCWSVNENSLLGPNSGSRVPVAVAGRATDVASLSVGTDLACFVTALGAVRCWGSGILGNNTSFSPVPVDVVGLSSGVLSVSAGFRHACALTALGAVKCWGPNDVGQLGNGSVHFQGVPVDVIGLSSGVISVAAGYAHSCAVTSAGAVKCWGANYYRQLGNDSMEFSTVPVDVVGLSDVVSISTGGRYTCAVTAVGATKCWGSLYWGPVGEPSTTSTSSVPMAVDGLSSNVSLVSVGDSHACALTSVGRVKCWGTNSFGELGNGTTIGSSVPVDVLDF